VTVDLPGSLSQNKLREHWSPHTIPQPPWSVKRSAGTGSSNASAKVVWAWCFALRILDSSAMWRSRS